jgi:hypothetical protein
MQGRPAAAPAAGPIAAAVAQPAVDPFRKLNMDYAGDLQNLIKSGLLGEAEVAGLREALNTDPQGIGLNLQRLSATRRGLEKIDRSGLANLTSGMIENRLDYAKELGRQGKMQMPAEARPQPGERSEQAWTRAYEKLLQDYRSSFQIYVPPGTQPDPREIEIQWPTHQFQAVLALLDAEAEKAPTQELNTLAGYLVQMRGLQGLSESLQAAAEEREQAAIELEEQVTGRAPLVQAQTVSAWRTGTEVQRLAAQRLEREVYTRISAYKGDLLARLLSGTKEDQEATQQLLKLDASQLADLSTNVGKKGELIYELRYILKAEAILAEDLPQR